MSTLVFIIELKKVQTRNVARLFIHERFDMDTLAYDIALIKLSKKVVWRYNKYIIPVCVDESDSIYPHYETRWLTGWNF